MEYDGRADLIDKLLMPIPVGHKKGNREKITEILKVDNGRLEIELELSTS